MKHSRKLLGLGLILALVACHSARAQKPIEPVNHVQLSRYMGRWYVIASIPTRFGRDGYNQVETYQLGADGAICTSFRFRDGGFQGPLKTIHSTATIVPGSGNAQWSVHLFWLLHAQYLVAWLAPDYSRVIVARDARDYVWLMARTPQVSPGDYRDMLARVGALGYDLQRVRKVPQQWPDQLDRAPAAALAGQCSS